MCVNIRKGQEVLLAFPVDLFCIITILRHDIIACQRTCFIKIRHTYRDIHHNQMGKFDFLRVMIHAMRIAESGKIHASTRFCVWEPAPAFFMKGVTVAASAPPESIRPAAVCRRLWMLKSGGRTHCLRINHQRKALGIWDGGTAAAWGGKTGKCPAFEFCCAFLICFSPWHSEAPHWLFSNDTV